MLPRKTPDPYCQHSLVGLGVGVPTLLVELSKIRFSHPVKPSFESAVEHPIASRQYHTIRTLTTGELGNGIV
jgi:hypothetical protein